MISSQGAPTSSGSRTRRHPAVHPQGTPHSRRGASRRNGCPCRCGRHAGSAPAEGVHSGTSFGVLGHLALNLLPMVVEQTTTHLVTENSTSLLSQFPWVRILVTGYQAEMKVSAWTETASGAGGLFPAHQSWQNSSPHGFSRRSASSCWLLIRVTLRSGPCSLMANLLPHSRQEDVYRFLPLLWTHLMVHPHTR